MFWADQLAEDVKDKGFQWIDDGWTASGYAHIGSLRGLIIHDAVKKALDAHKIKSNYTFIIDDFDPMDGLPIYLDAEKYLPYMGMPMRSIPSEIEGKSLADFFAENFIETMKIVGAKPEMISAYELYTSGKMDKAIKLALDDAEKIRDIYKKIGRSDKGHDWYPFNPVCPKCGKIGTTKTIGWDGKEVTFVCEPEMVDWATGCSYKEKISPFGGNGKLPYKVEWPAKWMTIGVTIEGEGKDHSAATGTRDVGNHIAKEIFNYKPPYDIPYEFFLLDGKKMSGSKGLGANARDIAELLPPEITRFMMIRNPKRAIEFNPSGVTIPNLFDEYDKAILAYNDPQTHTDLAKVAEYSQKEGKPFTGFRPRFIKLAYSIQLPRVDVYKEAEDEKGSPLDDSERNEIKRRIAYAEKWLTNFAPEQFKFEVSEIIPQNLSLSSEQKNFLGDLADKFSECGWEGQEIHEIIHSTKKITNINPKDAFSAIYFIFLGKDFGPQAGWFLSSLERDFVLNRISEAIK